jgi:xanthine dehydrogenase accessory factor
MRSVAGSMLGWLEEGHPAVLARLVDVAGSAPLAPGAMMLVGGNGTVLGSLSGGCVESETVERALTMLDGAIPDSCYAEVGGGGDTDPLLAAGLACGGSLRLLLQTVQAEDREVLGRFLRAQADREASVLVTRVVPGAACPMMVLAVGEGGDSDCLGTLGSDELDDEMTAAASGFVAAGRGGSLVRRIEWGVGLDIGEDILVHVTPRGPRLFAVGADEFSAALADAAVRLGWRVTVVDPRTIFADPGRFPEAEVLARWPNEVIAERAEDLGPDDAVCVLTHDRRVDVPAIVAALRTGVGYLGAMGSRRTHADRVERLHEAGLTEADLVRLHSPIGLDIGACTPAETAVAILAEIVAARSGRSGEPLRLTDGPIRAVRTSLICDQTGG